MKKGRPRILTACRERVFLEEVRMARYFAPKNIRKRYGISHDAYHKYIRRAFDEGRL